MFAQHVQAPRRKTSAPAKDSPQSESTKIEAVSEPLLANSPAYSFSLADMPVLPPSDPPPAKPAPLPNTLPSNLSIGAINDPHERAADKAAGTALSPSRHPALPSRLSVASESFTTAPPVVHQVLRTPGQPLHPAARAFFEPRFGYDLSRIRVHTDAQAAASASAIQARAYAAGNRIVFAPGQYGHTDPDRTQLLAHELAHILQQDTSSAVLRRQPTTKVDVGPNSIDLQQGQGGNGAVVYKYAAHTKLKPKTGSKGQIVEVEMPLLVYPPAKIDTSKTPPSVDIFIFFHGMRTSYGEETAETDADNSAKGYTRDKDNAQDEMAKAANLEQAAKFSGGRLVIAPQGPTTWKWIDNKDPALSHWAATSGQWTEALEATGFDGVIDAALQGLTKDLHLATPLVAGSIHVAGHSAGGRGIVESVSSTGAAKYRDKVQDITLEDAGYGGPKWDTLLDWLLTGSPGKTVRVLMSAGGGAKDAKPNEDTRVALKSALNEDAIKKKDLTGQFEVTTEMAPDSKDQPPMPLGFALESTVTVKNKATSVIQGTIVAFYSKTASHYPTVTGTLEHTARSGPNDTKDFLGDISKGKYRAIRGLAGKVPVYTSNNFKRQMMELPSGTAIDVVDVDAKNPHAVKVQTPDGKTGWMKSEDLSAKIQ